MVSKILKIIGIIAVVIVIFAFGYNVGRQPTTEEQTNTAYQAQLGQDWMTLSNDYQSLANLCESKYQTAIKGDYSGAMRINGQMDAIIAQVNTILQKYNGKVQAQ